MKWTNAMKEYPDETGCKAVWKSAGTVNVAYSPFSQQPQ